MTMLDPSQRDWTTCSDADVYHAARGGVHEAQVEERRREAAHVMTPAVAVAVHRARQGR